MPKSNTQTASARNAALVRTLLWLAALAARLRLGRRLPVLRRIWHRILPPGVIQNGPWIVHFHRGDTAISHALRTHGSWEPFECGLIARLLKPGDRAVDVGANIGLHTLVMSRACGEAGYILALEPDPENARLWRRNMTANRVQNAELLEIAAGDRKQTLRLFLSEGNYGDHRVYDSRDGRRSLEIQAQRLDTLLTERQLRPRLVKVDVQGWEPHVLAGAIPALSGSDPLALVTEFWSEGLLRAGSSASAYLSALAPLGLKFYRIDEANRRLIREPEDLTALRSAAQDTNLLGLRGIEVESLSVSVAS